MTVFHRETQRAPLCQDSLIGHIQFALRYEGINLEVLALLFQESGGEELQAWLEESPESKYARRAGFLYEWLTRRRLDVKVPAKARYVTVVDTRMQFGLERVPGTRNSGSSITCREIGISVPWCDARHFWKK